MKKLIIFVRSWYFFATFFTFVAIVAAFYANNCGLIPDNNFFVVYLTIITIYISAIGVINSHLQGLTQIAIQRNAQRISLFDKYATIYNAYIEDMTSLDFYEQAFLINPQQFKPMEHFNSKLVKVVNESRLLLTEKECIAIGTIGTYLNEIKHPMDFISKRAKEDNVQLDVDWGQILFIDNRAKITKEQITERFYAVIREYRLANEDAIDAIKQRRAKIKKIAEENNLEQVLERYCNINNILKH